jgi:putative Ca2+/H+ antiporter (TMEM165/GDT1 family)
MSANLNYGLYMAAFLASFVMIFFAEMGDKTQLLALAFASKYKISQVLLGVLIATLILNAAAVGAGKLLSTFIPLNVISVIASLSFIGFGLWSLKKETATTEEAKPSKFGPVATVTLAFLLGEIGDKTQLAAISLSVEYRDFIGVFFGASVAMFLADAAGILAGGFLKKYISEKVIRVAAAAIFIAFGLWGLWSAYIGHA